MNVGNIPPPPPGDAGAVATNTRRLIGIMVSKGQYNANQQKQKVQRFALLPDLPLPHLTGVLAIASVKAYVVIGLLLGHSEH